MTFELPGYPGRGVAIHRHADGSLEWVYLLTGRSPASQRRTLHAVADRVGQVPSPIPERVLTERRPDHHPRAAPIGS